MWLWFTSPHCVLAGGLRCRTTVTRYFRKDVAAFPYSEDTNLLALHAFFLNDWVQSRSL